MQQRQRPRCRSSVEGKADAAQPVADAVSLGTEIRVGHARMGRHSESSCTRLSETSLQLQDEEQVGELALVVDLPRAVSAPLEEQIVDDEVPAPERQLEIEAMPAPGVVSMAGNRGAIGAK